MYTGHEITKRMFECTVDWLEPIKEKGTSDEFSFSEKLLSVLIQKFNRYII